MKRILLSVLGVAMLSAIVTPAQAQWDRHHHRHQVCTYRHHHRICRWR